MNAFKVRLRRSPAAAPTCWQRMTIGLLDLTRLLIVLWTARQITAWWYVLTYETAEAITNDMVLQFSDGVDGWVPKDDSVTVERPGSVAGPASRGAPPKCDRPLL